MNKEELRKAFLEKMKELNILSNRLYEQQKFERTQAKISKRNGESNGVIMAFNVMTEFYNEHLKEEK